MNQTSATVLILASAVFSHAALSGITQDYTPQSSAIIAIAALATGIWGVLALIGSMIREREMLIDNHARLDVFNRFFIRDNGTSNKPAVASQRTTPPQTIAAQQPTSTGDQYLDLSPELHSQLSTIAEMEGRNRSDVIEETLRRHLPKYSKSRVA